MRTLVGEVPDDWLAMPLNDVADVLVGPSSAGLQAAPDSETSGVPVVTPRDIRGNRLADEATMSLRIIPSSKAERYRLAARDVVCVRTGDIGRQALVEDAQAGWLVGTGCLRIRPSAAIDARYLLYYLSHPAVHDWLRRNAMESTVPSIGSKTLRSLSVVVPPLGAQVTIAEILGSLDQQIAIHEQIARTTADLRDDVLQLLMARED